MTIQNTLTMKEILLSSALLFSVAAFSQAPLGKGKLELTLKTTPGGTLNRSGIAYDPVNDRYYSVNAGSPHYPMETYDGNGRLLNATPQGFDYRGVWYNPNTKSIEGNGFNSCGIWHAQVNSAHVANGNGKHLVSNTKGPDVQACADYDYNDNEIVYYYNGTIYRHDHETNELISSVSVSGLPVSSYHLNTTGIGYTGVKGMELGLWDYQNRKFYFIDKESGKYVTECQLPNSAPAQSYLKMGFENGLLWLYDGVSQWFGYRVLQLCEEVQYIAESRCDQYEAPSGVIYTKSGVYYDTISEVGKCDQITVIDLTIEQAVPSITELNGQLLSDLEGDRYQWYIEKGEMFEAVAGATDQIFTPKESGNYFIKVWKNDCEMLSESYDYRVAELTTIEDQIDILLYPNPSTLLVHVRHPFEEMQLKVFAWNGQQVLPDQVASKPIDISTLTPGVYIVELTAEHRTWSKMIVKQ